MLLGHLLATIGYSVTHLTPAHLENLACCVHELAPRLSHGFNQSQLEQLIPILFTVCTLCISCCAFLYLCETVCQLLMQGMANNQSVVRQWSVFALVQVCKSLRSAEVLQENWGGMTLDPAQIKLVRFFAYASVGLASGITLIRTTNYR